MNSVLSNTWMLGTLGLVALALVLLWVAVWPALRAAWQPAIRRDRWLFVFLCVMAILLLARPHQDSFVGLDTSCYRLMAHALAHGRPLSGTDQLLRETPMETRLAFILDAKTYGRDTRDRSFQVNPRTGAYEPYFYPTLPLAAAGLERMLHIGKAADYFVPLLGILLFCALLMLGFRNGRGVGALVAAALLIGSPVLQWTFRGFFAEAMGAALLLLAAMVWLSYARNIYALLGGGLALGLSIAAHPVFLLPALALLGLIGLSLPPGRRVREGAELLGAFGGGFFVLVLMTFFVCRPYGAIFDVSALWRHQQGDVPVRLILLGAFGFGLLGLAVLRLERWSSAVIGAFRRHVWIRGAGLLAALVPLLFMALAWSERARVLAGLFEWCNGVRLPFAIVLGAGIVITVLRPAGVRSYSLLLLALALAPVFFYLKGYETMGIWSQRRLLPLWGLLVTALVPGLAWGLASIRAAKWPAALVLALLGLVNACRWPAVYLTQYEKGADAWTEQARAFLQDRLAIFDYHHYSLPFAVDGQRVLGLSPECNWITFDYVMSWLGGTARQQEVIIGSAFANPGMESGMRLEQVGELNARLPRIRSKAALPVILENKEHRVAWLKVLPLSDQEPPPPLDKIMDGGPLALRGDWGRRRDIKGPSNQPLPAMWSRQTSMVIGPVPKPGASVHIEIQAAFPCPDPARPCQELLVAMPWADGQTVALVVSNAFTTAHADVARPEDQTRYEGRTGAYRIFSLHPYDPALHGTGGYDPDLGALIHRITIRAR